MEKYIIMGKDTTDNCAYKVLKCDVIFVIFLYQEYFYIMM